MRVKDAQKWVSELTPWKLMSAWPPCKPDKTQQNQFLHHPSCSILAPFCVLFCYGIRMHMTPFCIRRVSIGSILSIASMNWFHLTAPWEEFWVPSGSRWLAIGQQRRNLTKNLQTSTSLCCQKMSCSFALSLNQCGQRMLHAPSYESKLWSSKLSNWCVFMQVQCNVLKSQDQTVGKNDILLQWCSSKHIGAASKRQEQLQLQVCLVQWDNHLILIMAWQTLEAKWLFLFAFAQRLWCCVKGAWSQLSPFFLYVALAWPQQWPSCCHFWSRNQLHELVVNSRLIMWEHNALVNGRKQQLCAIFKRQCAPPRCLGHTLVQDTRQDHDTKIL